MYLCPNAFNQTTQLCKVARHIEHAIGRANDVHLGPLPFFTGLHRRHLLHAVFGPEPGHGAIGRLPLVFVNGARQKPRDVHAFGGNAPANHLGNRARDHHRGKIRIKHRMGALHGAFGAFATQLLFGKARNNNR
nr:hypothetical protein NCPCFENI_01311 [Cupriavidus sp.]